MGELGRLNDKEGNRYWEIKVAKFNLFNEGGGLINKTFWFFATLIFVLPLLFFAKFYARLKPEQSETSNQTDKISPAYEKFTDVYPFCLYSPITKGYEIELFKTCDLREPSLEIGIGDGYFSSTLFQAKNANLTYGSDLIFGTIKSATKYNHCDNFLVIDAMEIPLPSNSMQTVIMNNLIHHLPDRSIALKEVLRVLKKGGRFIFTENTIGWATFTWEQRLFRKFHLNFLADKILKFKLNLFAQKLLIDTDYYEKKASDENFKIIKKIPFVSRTSMYLGSLFEFLNLKQGQPTRKQMIRWTKIFGIKNRIDRYLTKIIQYCCVMDKNLGKQEGFAFQFIEIQKTKENLSPDRGDEGPIHYVCPKCKSRLKAQPETYTCEPCTMQYPIIDGIPILISYQDKLKKFRSYLDHKKKQDAKKFIT